MERVDSKSSVAVIGSGFGALATAIRLQTAGTQVTIFEKRDRAGGRAYVYREKGFVFDAGPTVITAPHCLEELFDEAGRSMKQYVELLPVRPLYRLCWDDGYVFDYTNDMPETLRQIAEKAPNDLQGYQQFLHYTEEVFEEGYTKLAHVPFLDFRSMLKVAPKLVRLQAYRSVYSIVSKFLKDKHLREAFSFHSLLVGGNPFTTSSIYTLIHFLERKWGVFFAKGGTGALVDGLVKLFTDLGGTIRYGAEIEEILTANGHVTGVLPVGGQAEHFDAVVSNADVVRTYSHLLKRESRVDKTRKRLERSRYSMSLFLIYFGTKKRYPTMAHHSVLFGPRYKGLLNDIFRTGKLAEDFSLYLHAPTVTDPSLAPEGCENFYVLSPVPHLGKAPIDWDKEGKVYADKILSYLEEKYLPGLRENLVVQKIYTPKDFERDLNAHLGSAFSLEPLLRQSAYFRVHNRDPHVQGLYFAGAGTHPGAGIPGTVNSGKATAKLVLEDLQERKSVRISASSAAPSLAEVCSTIIAQGSKSFRFASLLFDRTTRDGCHALYAFCRYCDDEVDRMLTREERLARVAELEAATRATYAGNPPPIPAFQGLAAVAKQFQIPERYPLELVEGMAMDARGERYRSFDDLLVYCHRVAGVVGLMMAHIMGVQSRDAMQHAADLGIAMQLTNIARDVAEDARLGRAYLPLAWLEEAGVSADALGSAPARRRALPVVRRLLAEADLRYASGNFGLRYLSFRCAVAVGTASAVYQAIGPRVLSAGDDGGDPWRSRSTTSAKRKLGAALQGLARSIAATPARWAQAPRSLPQGSSA